MKESSMIVRRFTTLLLASSLCACASRDLDASPVAALPAPGPRTARPNIVFIMSDDHAMQAISAYGHPVSRVAPTPNIDRIAANGVRFDNSFVTNSLCGPSRAAMLTGKFGHLNGFRQNGDIFDASQPTWPRALGEAGYQTALIGKWHLSGDPKGLNLDHWKVLDDQGEYYNPDFITAEGKVRVEGYTTDLITRYSLDWLKTKRDPDKPFLLMVHHKAPHRNWMPALRHVQTYQGKPFPVPGNYFDQYAGRAAAARQEMNIYRDMYEGHDLKMTKSVGSAELRYNRWPDAFDRMTPEQRSRWDELHQASNDAMNAAGLDGREMALWKYQRYLEEYSGTVAAVDEGVGEILDYLAESGLSDNTIVVYTSDQGFYLGEHGWFDKRFIYEESLRTPLLIQLPGRMAAGEARQAMVQNIDLAPTMLDYAGLPIPAEIQGRSLRAVAEGRPVSDWRNSIFYHYYEFPGFHAVRAHYGVRSDRYKLVHFYGSDIDAWEFYDLATDPGEMNNRIDDPSCQKQIATMRAELARLRSEYRDAGPSSGDVNSKADQ
jgi:arylsulfatase A-like enzyme